MERSSSVVAMDFGGHTLTQQVLKNFQIASANANVHDGFSKLVTSLERLSLVLVHSLDERQIVCANGSEEIMIPGSNLLGSGREEVST